MLVSSPSDWVSLPVSRDHEMLARSIRAERDALYPNLYAEAATDARWSGDLGEILLNDWFVANGASGVQWVREAAAGKSDFELPSGTSIGAKTVKRQDCPKLDYTAQISARHAKEPSDWLFFMTYCPSQRLLWLLGAIESNRFMHEARYYGPGDQVHPNYTIRPGHEIYNIGLNRLFAPARWLPWVRH